MLQVQAEAAGVGRHEDAAIGVVIETLDERSAVLARHVAMERHMAPWPARSTSPNHLVRAQPLVERHHLGGWVLQPFL